MIEEHVALLNVFLHSHFNIITPSVMENMADNRVTLKKIEAARI
jgi:hypothetical protein